MRPQQLILPFLVIIVLATQAAAMARTWRVELDGSGDFTDIQPAADAAAPGDTILIGPGRFDTFHECVAPGWTEEAIVSVLTDSLTFIGAGQGVTILGPETYYGTLNTTPKGICSFEYHTCQVQDLTIENVEEAIYWWTGNLRVERCTLKEESWDATGIFGTFSSAFIAECKFPMAGRADGIVLVAGTTDAKILGSRFVGGGYNIWISNQCTGIRIEDCVFEDNLVGVSFDTGSSGQVARCSISNPTDAALAMGNYCNVAGDSIRISGGGRGIIVAGSSVFQGTNIIIEGTTVAALQFASAGVAEIHNSHILPATGVAVQCAEYLGDHKTVDLTGNFWGTADPDSISALIIDVNDNPDSHYTVLFEPFANGPVPTEKQSLGSIKAMFR